MYTFEEVKPIRTKDAVSCDAKLFIDEFYASIDKWVFIFLFFAM